jgi:hypothetical protein
LHWWLRIATADKPAIVEVGWAPPIVTGSPVNTTVVTKVGITKIHERRYGTKWLFAFPKIAGGYGSITEFSLSLCKRYPYKDEKKSYLSARCPDGHLNGHATAIFVDDTERSGSFIRSCIPMPNR